MHSISFSAIREQARRMISIAASIPKDDRLWVTSSEIMYHALTTWCDLNGLAQKVHFVPAESIQWSDYTSNVFKSAYDETYGKNSSTSADWTRIHNDYLERLHFSYRVDAGFKKEIDGIRLALERRITYSNHESYRFIGHNLEPLILEFVMRTGQNPHVANPFIVGEEDLINPDYVSKLKTHVG